MDCSEDIGGGAAAFDDVGEAVCCDVFERFEGDDFGVGRDYVAAELCELGGGFEAFEDRGCAEDVDHVDEWDVHLGGEGSHVAPVVEKLFQEDCLGFRDLSFPRLHVVFYAICEKVQLDFGYDRDVARKWCH